MSGRPAAGDAVEKYTKDILDALRLLSSATKTIKQYIYDEVARLVGRSCLVLELGKSTLQLGVNECVFDLFSISKVKVR